MKTNQLIRRCSVLALGALTLTVVGCTAGGDGRHAGDIGMLRGDPTPALSTLAGRATDRENELAIMKDSNFRMIIDDIDRNILYINRPSRLTRFPTRH